MSPGEMGNRESDIQGLPGSWLKFPTFQATLEHRIAADFKQGVQFTIKIRTAL